MVDISKIDLNKLPKTAEGLLELAKSGKIKIPIAEIVPIKYAPLGCWARVLVASEEFVQTGDAQPKKRLVYVEASSQHGTLNLLGITKGPIGTDPPWYKNLDAQYDRDPKTRNITSIYLNEKDVFGVAFCGTLDELMRHPNVAKRD